MNLQVHHCFKDSSGVVTDSRKLSPDCLFIALRGENFDGNQFAEMAIESGAKYALVDQPEIAKRNTRMILVEDTLKTLQQLAQYHRKTLKAKIIGLTGSNGKTTTRELIKSVLSQKYNTQASKGNFNNHIGVPLTLLDFDENTEIGIVEMGANHLREIDFLCQLAQPDVGLITNFGEAHLEGFGGLDGVIKGKSELHNYLSQTSGTIILNIDDPIQKKWKLYNPNFTFGEDKEADCHLEYLKRKSKSLAIRTEDKTIESKLYGEYNYTNIATAVALGRYFKLTFEQIKLGVSTYKPSNNRSQIIHSGNNTITLDAYNANPTSMSASISSFENNRKKRGVVILGDMFELGKFTEEAHQKILNQLISTAINDILLLGACFFKTKSKDSRVRLFKSDKEIIGYLIDNPVSESDILIKGSRVMAMEKLLEYL